MTAKVISKRKPLPWLVIIMAVLLLAVGLIPVALNLRVQAGLNASRALGQPGVDSAEVSTRSLTVNFADNAASSELTRTLQWLQGFDGVAGANYRGINIFPADELSAPDQLADVLWTLGRDGDFTGRVSALRDGAPGISLEHVDKDADCASSVLPRLGELAETTQNAWSDLSVICGDSFYVQLLPGSDASTLVAALSDASAQLADISAASGEERRLSVTVAEPNEFSDVRDALLVDLGGLEWPGGFRVTMGSDGLTIEGAGAAPEALTLADQITAAGMTPRTISTDLATVSVRDEGLANADKLPGLVPTEATLWIWRDAQTNFFIGPAGQFGEVLPILRAIDQPGAQLSTDLRNSRLTFDLADAGQGCDQDELSCTDLADRLAALPGPLTVRVKTDSSNYSELELAAGRPASIIEDAGIEFATQLAAAWDARA